MWLPVALVEGWLSETLSPGETFPTHSARMERVPRQCGLGDTALSLGTMMAGASFMKVSEFTLVDGTKVIQP